MPYRDEIRTITDLFRLRFIRQENSEMMLLANRWGALERRLQSLIKELSELEAPTVSQLYELERWKEFVSIANKQYSLYAEYAYDVIVNGKEKSAELGLELAQTTIALKTDNFHHLPISAVNEAITRSFYDGSPLKELLLKRYGESFDKVAQTIVESTAFGRNPILTARLIGADLTGSLYNTLRIVRTEQIDIFRESSRSQYIESGIVKGLDLLPASDACEVCLEVASRNSHPLNYPFDELHANCRCPIAPHL